ncbi:MAG: rhodanese-like domain-containing protein [Halobacteriovoraceae bacterium]|nr:rhodanese-like domain-containing protein [Halobacteriovoraceae bacterium]MCB9095756.1 rhodanese-like domain-containing protein [Halobacteriovoraceae bacterium]
MKLKHVSIENFYHEHFGKLEEGELILDVRTPEEFSEGHVPGSKNISHDQVANHVEELKQYKRIYVLCRRGGRAQVALSSLIDHMPETQWVCVSDGGMDRWNAAQFPVEK